MIKIKTYIKQIRGITYGGSDAIEYPSVGYLPVLRSNNINEGSLNFDNLVYVPERLIKDEQKLRKGDILITASTGSMTVIGKNGAVQANFDGSFGAFCKVVRPLSSINMDYLKHFFQSPDYRKKIRSVINGANINNIKNEHIDNLELRLPPLETQQKIAAILDKADELRQYNKQLIEKYDALTQSLFLDMFGDPVRNDKGFLKSTIGEQCTVKGGKRVPKSDRLVKENTGYSYIKAGNIKNGKVTTKNLEYLLPSTRKKLQRYTVNEGDVCITVVGVNIGDVGIVPKELHQANLTENANKLLINNQELLNSVFLASYLQMDFIQKEISKKTMAVGVPKLALFRIEQLELLLPSLGLQNHFAESCKLIESQKQQAQEALQKTEALFQGLLQQAFKGELINDSNSIVDYEVSS